jgi:uncharacterized repeat protein (TIGR01451 family)
MVLSMGKPARAAAFLAAMGLLALMPATALAGSNLAIDHTAEEPDPVVQGANVTYTIEVKNNGPDAAKNVNVRDYVPGGTAAVAFAQMTGPAFSLSFLGPEFAATIANFPAGAAASFKSVYTATTSSPISHKIQVASSTPDPDFSDNEDLEGTSVLPRGLSLTVADKKDPVVPGGNIEYDLTLQNRGGSIATAVTVEDTLAPQTTFVSVSGPPGWTLTTPPVGGTGQISATNPSVAAGSTHTFALVVNAPSAGLIENAGQVTGSGIDGNALDNYDTELTTVAVPVLTQPQLPTAPTTLPTPAATGPTATCGGKAATIVGTAAADELKGTPGADVIAALAGRDTVKGRGGNDLICGDAGADLLFGGGGADRLLGGSGKDTCSGGAGKDRGGCERKRSF